VSRRNGRPSSLRLEHFNDRDLLGILEDNRQADGWTHALDVATTCFGIHEEDPGIKHASRCLGVRLSWLKRYGVVEKHPRERQLWRLTKAGRMVHEGTLTPAQVKAVQQLREGQLMHLTNLVGERSARSGQTVATMTRRAWMYQQAQRER
jgi:hypothetical protein